MRESHGYSNIMPNAVMPTNGDNHDLMDLWLIC